MNLNLNILRSLSSGGSIYVSQFGASPSADGASNRIAIQNAINASSGKTILFESGTYTVELDSNGKGLELKSNSSMEAIGESNTVLHFIPSEALKTSNFSGGTVAADQVRAITIDNSSSPISNLSFVNISFTTPLMRWYDANEFLQSVPICFYLNNTNVEADYSNSTPTASNYTFTNCAMYGFQRGSVSVRGRKINNVIFSGCTFLEMASQELQYPTESRYIYTDIVVDSLAKTETSYDFAMANGVSYTLILYNGSEILYTIPYTTSTANASIGSITNNPLTAGLMEWSIDAGVLASVTSLSVHATQRTTDTTTAPNINGMCIDFSNVDGLTITGCTFTGCADQYSHYIYCTRRTDNILITNNAFNGRGVKKTNAGGGVHIRGASYTNVTITNNTFTNVKDHNINLSSVTNAVVTGNIMNWNYDQNAFGSLIDFTYGALDTCNYSDNTITSTNTFLPITIALAYSATSTDAIEIKDNNYTNVALVAPLSKNVEFWGNTVVGSAYTLTNASLIVMSHNNVSDTLNISFKNNAFTFGVPASAQPLIAGFSGFTWDNNTISPSVNLMRLGDALKLDDVTVQNCAINALRLNCTGDVNITSYTGIISYYNDAAYLDMLQNQNVIFSNVTDTASQPRSVAANNFNILGTGARNMGATSSQACANFDVRVFNNVNLPYQITITNVSSYTVTLEDYTTSGAPKKNLDNGGGDYSLLADASVTYQLDKVNARWVKQ